MDSLVATCGMREGFSQNGGMRRSGVRGRRALCTLNTVQLHGRLVGVLPEWDPSGRGPTCRCWGDDTLIVDGLASKTGCKFSCAFTR